MERSMDMENRHGSMMLMMKIFMPKKTMCMRVTGKTIKKMVKAHRLGLMVTSMKVSGKMMIKMVMAH